MRRSMLLIVTRAWALNARLLPEGRFGILAALDQPHLGLEGRTNFSAVWVGEKLATLMSIRPASRPAFSTSISRIFETPLGYTTHAGAAADSSPVRSCKLRAATNVRSARVRTNA